MKTTTTTTTEFYSNSFYAEMVNLANQFWQQTGCEFGKYPECLMRARSELTVSNQSTRHNPQTEHQTGAHDGVPPVSRPSRRKQAGHTNRT
jgi:hypothetical protein